MSHNQKIKNKQILQWFLRQSIKNPVEPNVSRLDIRTNLSLLQIVRDLRPQDIAVGLYALVLDRHIYFSMFFWIGRHYFPAFIPGSTVIGNSLILLHVARRYLKAGVVASCIYVFSSPVLEGILIGAGLAHLSIPSEPSVWLTTVVVYSIATVIMVKRMDISIPNLFPAIFIISFLLHIFIGILFGWLSLTYVILSVVYSLAPIAPLITPHGNGEPFSVIHVTIFSKCVAYWIVGVENMVLDE